MHLNPFYRFFLHVSYLLCEFCITLSRFLAQNFKTKNNDCAKKFTFRRSGQKCRIPPYIKYNFGIFQKKLKVSDFIENLKVSDYKEKSESFRLQKNLKISITHKRYHVKKAATYTQCPK